MKTLIAVGLMAVSVCAYAEEKASWLDAIGSLVASSGEVAADAEAMKDKSITNLVAQIEMLKGKYQAAKASSSAEASSLKKKLAECKDELKKKYADFKAEQKRKYEDAKAKRKAERSQATVSNTVDIVGGILNLFGK